MFKHFSRKGYSLFSVLGKEVLIGVLSVATANHAMANSKMGIDTLSAETEKTFDDDDGVLLDEVDVTGSRVPMSSLQSAKAVTIITREEIQRSEAQSVNDLLKLTTGVDVRQRGGFGVQTDISINGGTFDQITILLNGIDISSPQTGHNAADFPVNIDDIERIEILEGAAARIFGVNAFSGSINIVTKTEPKSGLRISAQGGSFGTFGAGVSGNISNSATHHQLSTSYDQSDGGMENTAFKLRKGYYQGDYISSLFRLRLQAGLVSKDYGAGTFYSAKFPNQYEETRRFITSFGADIHDRKNIVTVSPAVYWHRDYDHYQLTKDMTGAAAGENYHRMDVYGFSVNSYVKWILGKTALGVDIRKDRIISTTYGTEMDESDWKTISGSDRYYTRKGSRTNSTIYLEHNVLLKKITISAGIMANYNSFIGGGLTYYPGIDVSYRPDGRWKFFASWNKAMRVPTYTDLYTNNKAQCGSLDLLPEKNNTTKIGCQYTRHGISAAVNGFYSHATNLIDWVYETQESTVYQALNIGKIDNLGFSVDGRLSFRDIITDDFILDNIKVGYAYIHQTHDTDHEIYRSLYALEYLRHKVTAQLSHRIFSHLSATWSYRWQQRMNGYKPYSKVDVKMMWRQPHYEISLQADNLTCHRYYDLGGVEQPGLCIIAGIKIFII